MRSLPNKFILGGVAIAFAVMTFKSNAQTEPAEPEKTLKISISETEGDQTKTSEKEIRLENQTLESLVNSLGVLNGWDLSEDGDEIEIVIRKKTPGESETQEVVVEMALPAVAQEKLEELIEQSRIEWEEQIEKELNKPLLGVYSSSNEKGARINRIIPNSGAADAGLQAGDVILSFDGQAVTSHSALTKQVLAKQPGDEVELEIEREGVAQKVTATLGKRNIDEADFDFDFDFDDFNFEHHHNKGQKSYNRSFRYDITTDENEKDAADRPFLGVSLSSNNGPEVVVSSVFANSSAQEMGLQPGDRIVSFNQKEVTSLGELINQIRDLKPGDKADIVYERNGEQNAASGTLKSKAETNPEMEGPSMQRTIVIENNGDLEETREVVLNLKVVDATPEEEEEWLEKNNLAQAPKLEIENIRFSPNPNRGQFRLTFDLVSEGETVLEIRDVNGAPVRVQVLGNFTGAYQEDFNISEQPGGVYFLTVTQNGQRFVKKIVKD